MSKGIDNQSPYALLSAQTATGAIPSGAPTATESTVQTGTGFGIFKTGGWKKAYLQVGLWGTSGNLTVTLRVYLYYGDSSNTWARVDTVIDPGTQTNTSGNADAYHMYEIDTEGATACAVVVESISGTGAQTTVNAIRARL